MLPSRARLPAASSGPGKHFTSPIKPRDKKKTATFVVPPGHASKKQRLVEKLEVLTRLRPHQPPADIGNNAGSDPIPLDSDDVFSAYPSEDPRDIPSSDAPPVSKNADEPYPQTEKGKKRILPDAESFRLYANWTGLLPTVVDSLLQYLTRSVGHPISSVTDLHSRCVQSCVPKSLIVKCLFYDRESLNYDTPL